MDAYDELYVYTMTRPEFLLQHVVDASVAQNAPASNPPSIGAIFALVGLYLHLEHGFTGFQVQKAHRIMGRTKRIWPELLWPADRGARTASAVMALPQGRVRDDGIDQWCRDVWAAFGPNRDTIVALVSEFNILQLGL